MKIEIGDERVQYIAQLLGHRGFSTRLVGGAVRDIVCGQAPKDMDMATDTLPNTVMDIALAAGLRVIPTGLQHGTVTVVVEGEPYEVTTLRKDVETDGRHATVAYISDFRLDAARRDFTFNAMSVTMDGELHDYFGGVADLSQKRVRFVGDANERIHEDFLRILRFFRFRARFGGLESDSELSAIYENRKGLENISVERIWSEVSRILIHPNGPRQLLDMRKLGVAEMIGLPVDESIVLEATGAVRHGATPGIVLGMLCYGDRELSSRLPDMWKLSKAEALDVQVSTEVHASTNDAASYWIGRATDGLDPVRAASVLLATGRTEAGNALLRSIPVFPLKGLDLLHAGFAPGPEMGKTLNELKTHWKLTEFAATKEELIDLALLSVAQHRGM